jgi:short-subunit dehydrogenase
MPLPQPSPTSTALVTGSSSGIGEQIATELARRGHGLTLVARREDRLRALADDLHSRFEVAVEVVPADLTDSAARAAIAERLDELGLAVDILVNNAGFTTMGPVHRADRERELALVRTNVEAVVDLCTMFVGPMTTRRRGAVLNTASTAAFQPLPAQAGYGASKAFVLSYSRALGAELRGTGVTVTALCPGPVETGFADVAGMTDEEAEQSLPRFMWVAPEQVAKAAVDGMAAARPVVIPGAANAAGAMFGYLAPRRLILPFMVKRHPAMQASWAQQHRENPSGQ